jgi:protein phosphatase
MSGLYDRHFLKIGRAACTAAGVGGDARNQDAVANDQTIHGHLLVVADGHDSGGRGGVASRMVIETILEHYRKWNGQGPRKMLVDAIGLANAALRQAAQSDKRLAGVAVSVAMLHHQDGTVRIAHVGNCRAYRLRNYVIDQLTEDHLALSPTGGEAAAAKPAYVLERAVGLYPIVEVDVSDAHLVQAGETFLLCTDGLTTRLNDVEIGRQAMGAEPQAACEGFAKLAVADNNVESVTAAMIKFSDPPEKVHKLSEAVTPSPTLILAAGNPLWPLSWNRLAGWWKLRLAALAVLVLWFLVLLGLWWLLDLNVSPAFAWPLVLVPRRPRATPRRRPPP